MSRRLEFRLDDDLYARIQERIEPYGNVSRYVRDVLLRDLDGAQPLTHREVQIIVNTVGAVLHEIDCEDEDCDLETDS